MTIKIVSQSISKSEIDNLAQDQFGDMVKAAVDVKRQVLAVGGELHADAEALLLEQGSRAEDVWGINLYPDRPENEWLEFNSLINIKPSLGNRSTKVESLDLQNKIMAIVNKLVTA